MTKEKIELVAISVVDFMDLGFQALADPDLAILWVFIANLGEDAMTLSVDKIHQFKPMLERNGAMPLEEFLDIQQDVLGSEVFCLFLIKPMHLEMIESDGTGDLNNIDEPITQLFFKGLKR